MGLGLPFPAPSFKRTVMHRADNGSHTAALVSRFTLQRICTSWPNPRSDSRLTGNKRYFRFGQKRKKLGVSICFRCAPATDIRQRGWTCRQGPAVSQTRATEDLSSEAERRAKRACPPKPAGRRRPKTRVPILRTAPIEPPVLDGGNKGCGRPPARDADASGEPSARERATFSAVKTRPPTSQGVIAERLATEASKRYEAALPALQQSLARPASREFATSVRRRISRSSPRGTGRVTSVGDEQQKIAFAASSRWRPRARTVEERQTRGRPSARRQDELFVGKSPDMRKNLKATDFKTSHPRSRRSDSPMGNWNALRGDERFPLRDTDQLLILDGSRYRDAPRRSPDVVAKPALPARDRRLASPRGGCAGRRQSSAEQRLETSGNLKDAGGSHCSRAARPP